MFRFIILISLFLISCSQQNKSESLQEGLGEKLYSTDGREMNVEFKAEYRTNTANLTDINPTVVKAAIRETVRFLFGPLTNRQLAAPQKGEIIEILQNEMRLVNGKVIVPYQYKATWLIHKEALSENNLTVPVPYSIEGLRTSRWNACTEQDPEHGTWSFFWYFWDPSRPGCDHQVGKQFQNVQLKFSQETLQTTLSFPEYQKMIRLENGVKSLSMTFAFGYVSEENPADPFKDSDAGIREFQSFLSTVEKTLLPKGFKKELIQGSQYGATYQNAVGVRFTGKNGDLEIRVSVVAAANIDQMDLFAYSYAHQHEGFFGWFGHSRVGSGFDAEQFAYRIRNEPEFLSISPQYQLIYWAGCNSYSYYTLPFFKMKADLNPTLDPHGTKNLDIISNGFPSYFSLNANNANVLFEAVMGYQKPRSYQQIVNQIEKSASWLTSVMVNVLGDEDNQ